MTAPPSASGEVIRGLTLTTNYGSSSRDWRWCQHVVADLFISLVDPPKLLQFFSSFTFCLPERQQGIPPIQMITFRCLLTNLLLHEHPNQRVQLKWSKGLRIGMMGFTWWQGKERKKVIKGRPVPVLVLANPSMHGYIVQDRRTTPSVYSSSFLNI